VRQDGAAHEDGDLLDDLDAGVARLPRLLGLADGLEEGQQGGDAEGGRDDGEGARRRVTHVLVQVVDVRTHRAEQQRNKENQKNGFFFYLFFYFQ